MVRQTVERHFPHLWPAVDLGLATCATLLLKDNANPAAVIFVGPPAVGKTTVATMFADASICYRSDKFTPAAFVSHSAKATKTQLESIDLLPRIRFKVLNTPELSTMFRGKADELLERFSIITRVLDGQGLISDSGTHGQRGYMGDYLFAWLGCTTPFDASVWRVMGQLGSRLFFYLLDTHDTINMDIFHGGSYLARLTECRKEVSQFIDQLFAQYGVRGVAWDTFIGPSNHHEQIAALARLLSILRTLPTYDGAAPIPEAPMRAQAVLSNLARGHALVHGRTQLTEDDLSCLTHVTLSSMPVERRQAVLAFGQSNSHTLSVGDLQTAIRARSDQRARTLMDDLDWLGLADYWKAGQGKPSILHLRPSWQWITEERFQALLKSSNLLKNGG